MKGMSILGFARQYQPLIDISVLGYAIYTAMNAVSLWGGVFPFFPMEFQTVQVTLVFALAQSAAFLATFIATTAAAYFFPRIVQKTLILTGALPMALGACTLIAALYLEVAKIPLVALAGILLGVGSAGFAMAWQRYFSACSAAKGNLCLLVGTALAPFVYFALYAVPSAVTVYLTPLILVPVCGLCAMISTRRIDFEQSQFEDVPRESPRVYAKLISDYWKPVIAIGSIGFVSGVVRAWALSDASMGDTTNIASMVGLLAVSLLMLILWHRQPFSIDIRIVYLALFPLVAIAMVVFPFLDPGKMFYAAGFVYALFSLASVITLLQCAQIARDRGVNPAFIYGAFGSVVYLLQNAGLLFGLQSTQTADPFFGAQFVDTTISLFVLSLALYCLRGGVRLGYVDAAKTEGVEFVSLDRAIEGAKKHSGKIRTLGIAHDATTPLSFDYEMPQEQVAGQAPLAAEPEKNPEEREPEEEPQNHLREQCLKLQEQYGLTKRETEITEMLARGNTVARIAEILVVSENTVRTHAKHIYTKLDVHKRQDIIDLISASE